MKIQNSERLKYRLLDANDADLLFRLDQNPEVMKYITQGKTPSLDDIYTVFIPRLEKYHHPEKGWGMWGVFTLEDEFLGWIIVRPMNFFSDSPEWDNLELGWRFFQEAWGKGYGSESAKQIMDEVIKVDGVKKVCAIAHQDNHGSIGIMKKLGMNYIKTYTHKDKDLPDMEVVYYEKNLTKN